MPVLGSVRRRERRSPWARGPAQALNRALVPPRRGAHHKFGRSTMEEGATRKRVTLRLPLVVVGASPSRLRFVPEGDPPGVPVGPVLRVLPAGKEAPLRAPTPPTFRRPAACVSVKRATELVGPGLRRPPGRPSKRPLGRPLQNRRQSPAPMGAGPVSKLRSVVKATLRTLRFIW